MRKIRDDVLARGAAEHFVADRMDEGGLVDASATVAGDLLGSFPAIEFETIEKKIGPDETVHLRRVVITGPWEVDASATK